MRCLPYHSNLAGCCKSLLVMLIPPNGQNICYSLIEDKQEQIPHLARDDTVRRLLSRLVLPGVLFIAQPAPDFYNSLW